MDETPVGRDDPAHVAVYGHQAAGMTDTDLAAVTSGPTRGDDLTIGGGNDRAAPAGADVDPGVEPGEMQDRVITIAEIGGDRPSGRHPQAGFNPRPRALGIGCAATIGAAGRAGGNSIGSAASAGAMRMRVSPPLAKGEMASACHWRCPSLRNARGLGSDAIATPLHSKANRPAVFHPMRGIPSDSARAPLALLPKPGVILG